MIEAAFWMASAYIWYRVLHKRKKKHTKKLLERTGNSGFCSKKNHLLKDDRDAYCSECSWEWFRNEQNKLEKRDE